MTEVLIGNLIRFKLIYLVLILALNLFCLLAFYTFKHLSRGWSFKVLFKEFNRKIWMTISLGGLFFGLYLFTVSFGAYLVHYLETDLFFLFYQNPVPFIYGGLWLFIFVSLSIYLARMVIKYFYLTKGRDR